MKGGGCMAANGEEASIIFSHQNDGRSSFSLSLNWHPMARHHRSFSSSGGGKTAEYGSWEPQPLVGTI